MTTRGVLVLAGVAVAPAALALAPPAPGLLIVLGMLLGLARGVYTLVHATAVTDTVAWLDEARIPYRDLCFLGAKPEVEADAYVDDGPHNVIALRELGNDVIVFEQPYNRHLDGLRAHSWREVEEIVEALAATKGEGLQRQLPGFDAGTDRIERRRGAPPID